MGGKHLESVDAEVPQGPAPVGVGQRVAWVDRERRFMASQYLRRAAKWRAEWW